MKNISIFMLFISLISPIFSVENANSSKPEHANQIGLLSLRINETQQAIDLHSLKLKETQQKLGLLSLRAKETRHISLVYRHLRFPDRFTSKDLKEMIELDNEACKLRENFSKCSALKPIGHLKPIGDEKTILQELCKKYYSEPVELKLQVSYGHLPKEYFPIEILFSTDQEESRSILLSTDVHFLLQPYREPGYMNVGLPFSWVNLEKTYVSWTHEGRKRIKWDNLLQKSKSFDWTDRSCTETDCNSLSQTGPKYPSLEAPKDYMAGCTNCTTIFSLIMYHGLDEPTSFTYNIVFCTSNNLLYFDDFYVLGSRSSSYTLEEKKFI